MKARVPFWAPIWAPETGASTMATACLANVLDDVNDRERLHPCQCLLQVDSGFLIQWIGWGGVLMGGTVPFLWFKGY